MLGLDCACSDSAATAETFSWGAALAIACAHLNRCRWPSCPT